MTILLTGMLIFMILTGSVALLVGTMQLAERAWRRAAEADIIRRAEELLRAHANPPRRAW